MSESLITCRTCGSQNQKKLLSTKDLNQKKSDECFAYYLCNDCKSVFLDPVPDNLEYYYDKNYPAYVIKNRKNIEDKLGNLEQAKLEIVKQYVTSGRLIEVGPAAGKFLLVASRAGYEVLGIEQDAGSVEYIKNTLNLDVKSSNKPSEELLKLVGCCDVIVAWHVIEHLQELRGFIAAASNALCKPSGILIVSAPNPDSWSFKFFRRYWVHLDAPRHLTLIPPKALDKLMADHGLVRVACIFDDLVGLQLNKNGWQTSFINLSCNKLLRSPFLSGLGRILSIVMLPFDRFYGRGSAYTAIYRNIGSIPYGLDAHATQRQD